MTMHTHKAKRYRVPDRRGGKSNQPKPKLSEKHTHIMVQWGDDTRYRRCEQAGCQYAEVEGKPVLGGKKERSRDADVPVTAVQNDLFADEDMDRARFGHQLAWGEVAG